MKQQGPFYLVGRNTSAAYGAGARGGRGVGGVGRGGYVARGGAAVGARGGHSSGRGGGHGGDYHQSQDARAASSPAGDDDDGEWTSVGRAGRVVSSSSGSGAANADGGSRWTSSSRGGQQQTESRFTRNGSGEADAPKWQRNAAAGATSDAGADDGATKTWRSSRLQSARKQEPR
jgi:hypothetical protein